MEKYEGNIFKIGSKSEHSPRPEEVRLADGRPLYYLLMEDANPVVLSKEDSESAHERLRDLFAKDPNAILAMDGMDESKAREMLTSVENAEEQGMSEAA